MKTRKNIEIDGNIVIDRKSEIDKNANSHRRTKKKKKNFILTQTQRERGRRTKGKCVLLDDLRFLLITHAVNTEHNKAPEQTEAIGY